MTPLLLVLLILCGAVRAEEPKAQPIARRVLYSGRVQGVGFRATAVHIARNYAVTGWVRNLADGRVEMLVEGSEEEVKKFLEAIRTHWKDEIVKEQVEVKEPTGRYRVFGIER
jgi:acylphosphatase